MCTQYLIITEHICPFLDIYNLNTKSAETYAAVLAYTGYSFNIIFRENINQGGIQLNSSLNGKQRVQTNDFQHEIHLVTQFLIVLQLQYLARHLMM
jgi:hypothetical protein